MLTEEASLELELEDASLELDSEDPSSELKAGSEDELLLDELSRLTLELDDSEETDPPSPSGFGEASDSEEELSELCSLEELEDDDVTVVATGVVTNSCL